MPLIFRTLRWLAGMLLLTMPFAQAQTTTAAFDLAGPAVDVRVQRAGDTLPISHVPNLLPGDRLWIHPQLPESQSTHYLMIVAFLRGATNPPPPGWFTKVETWSKGVRDEGVFVVVPDEAEQALIFLAPETGGDFNTLRNAVRGKPGAFVRAAQDLQQASLDRIRLERYLLLLRQISADPSPDLHERTTLLARSLNIKLDHECFDKPSSQQVPCLTQNSDSLVLDDAHTETMVARITSGTNVDLVSHLALVPTVGAGVYSPYVGAIVDTIRILSSAHTAQYQYIPALALPKGDKLNLRLNNPPSFRNPKSVLVVGLPPVGASPLPPLRSVEPHQAFCAGRPDLVLPIDGAPLVFATELAHDFKLHVQTKGNGSPGIDLPAKVDPTNGGIVVDTRSIQPDTLDDDLTGTLHGFWGFQPLEGPSFHLRSAQQRGRWIVPSKDASALIVGRLDALNLQSSQAACVENVSIRTSQGARLDASWKQEKPDELQVGIPLEGAAPGSIYVMIKKFGNPNVDEVTIHTYAEAGSLESLRLYAGDTDGILKGTRLDQVKEVEVKGMHFAPGNLSRFHQKDELTLVTKDPSTLTAGETVDAQVTLKDGRVLNLSTPIDQPRPRVKLISKSVQFDPSTTTATIKLSGPDELPQEGRLSFFLKAQVPENFSPSQKVEVATLDESFRVFLTVADGNLTMQDSKTELAVLDPMRHLGPSAFGPLKMRPVLEDGTNGDWQPLVNLVRIPTIRDVHCASLPTRQCTITGDKLFLIESVSTNADFTDAAAVPEGFVEQTLVVPAAHGHALFLKLRDDPNAVDTMTWTAPPPSAATTGPTTATSQ
jgi:hypothetical protein